MPHGHCRSDGWCWVMPTPVGGITGVFVASPSTTYVASGRDLFRIGGDGGLVYDQQLPVSATFFEQTPAGLWVSGESGIARVGAQFAASPASGLKLLASSSGALWGVTSFDIQRFNGISFEPVAVPPDPCMMASYATFGPNLLRHCKIGLFLSTLQEISPAGAVTTHGIDGGDVFGIAGRSTTGLVANAVLPGSGMSQLMRISPQGSLTPLLSANLLIGQTIEMGADENTVWNQSRSSVYDLGAGIQNNYFLPNPPYFSAGFGKVIAASSNRVWIPETTGPGVELLQPPQFEPDPSSVASAWFLDDLSVLSCDSRILVQPSTEYVPSNVVDIAKHPSTGERLIVTSTSIMRPDGGVVPAINGNLRPSRILPFGQSSWLALGSTNGVSWSWVFDGIGWVQVPFPTTPDAGLILGISQSDAGIHVTTGGALASFNGTGWTVQTPSSGPGPLTTICSLGPVLLVERIAGSTRTIEEYRSSSAAVSRPASNSRRLMCAGQRAFDVERAAPGALSEFLLDGGQYGQPSPITTRGIAVDREDRLYVFGDSCAVLRR